MSSRRGFIGSTAAAALAAALPAPSRAQEGRPPGATVQAVTGQLHVVGGVGGNVVVLASPDQQLLVDSGSEAGLASLQAALAELPGQGRVARLFNTHWHAGQTGGNAAFGRSGTVIVAHEKTRLRLSTDYYVATESRYVPALPREAQPAESFFDRGETIFAGEAIEYGHLLQAHTDGDLYLHFRDANLIAVGDALSPLRDPVLDWFGGGWLGGRADSLDRLKTLSDANTRFVPAYGPVVNRDYLDAEHALMATLYDRVQALFRQGMSARDMLADGVMDGLTRRFDDPGAFLDSAYRGMWAHHNTISHDIV